MRYLDNFSPCYVLTPSGKQLCIGEDSYDSQLVAIEIIQARLEFCVDDLSLSPCHPNQTGKKASHFFFLALVKKSAAFVLCSTSDSACHVPDLFVGSRS